MSDLNKDAALKNIIHDENQFWTNIFVSENLKQTKDFSHYWWKLYYKEISEYVKQFINLNDKDFSILEAGSGSGKASILLGKNINRTFLDISEAALTYAKKLSAHFGAENIKYIEGDIFNMPFKKKTFSLVWNIGVIEHYEINDIILMMKEMYRVTKDDGYIIIGFPNYHSLPIKKAKILKKKIFNFIPGYRLGSEKFYEMEEIIRLAEINLDIKLYKSVMVGNPLIMETPKFILKLFGTFLAKKYSHRKFLNIIVLKK